MRAKTAIGILLAGLPFFAGPATADIYRAHFGISYGSISYEAANVIQSLSVDQSEGDYRFFGGYRLLDNLLVEGTWISVSGFESSFTYDIPGLGPQRFVFDAEYEVLTARLLGYLPTEKLNLFAGVGYYDSKFDGLASWPIFTDSPTPVERAKTSETGLTMIAGVEYRLSGSSGPGFRLDYERFDTKSGIDTSAVNIGIVFRFY